MHSPAFWAKGGWLPFVLGPMGLLWGLGGWLRRAFTKPYRAAIPVICVGNLVVGGAGKTPVTLAIAHHLRGKGINVHLLGRGYGGEYGDRLKGPTKVDPTRHLAAEVGDEALLLAAAAPTWVGADRAAAARAATDAGAACVVLDDGFQDPSLEKDLSLLVVDGAYGFGNGRVVPAGPLREPVAAGLQRAQAVVLVGQDEAGVGESLAGQGRLLRAQLVPASDMAERQGDRFLAFAGIGRPEKFFASLRKAGFTLAGTRAFPDHHVYRREEVEALVREAESLGALPITTAKDAVRLPEDFRDRVIVFPVRLVWQDVDAVETLLRPLFRSP